MDNRLTSQVATVEKKNSNQISDLLTHGGPILRWRTAMELIPEDATIDREALLADLLACSVMNEGICPPISIVTSPCTRLQITSAAYRTSRFSPPANWLQACSIEVSSGERGAERSEPETG